MLARRRRHLEYDRRTATRWTWLGLSSTRRRWLEEGQIASTRAKSLVRPERWRIVAFLSNPRAASAGQGLRRLRGTPGATGSTNRVTPRGLCYRTASMTCPHCSSPAPANVEFCPTCLGMLSAPPGAPSSTTSADPPSTSSSSVACPQHADRPVIGTCARCGTFVCILCAPSFASDETLPCARCVEAEGKREAQQRSNRTIRAVGGLAIAYGVLAGGLAFFSSGPLAALFALPLFGLGALTLITAWRWVGYPIFVCQVLTVPFVGGIMLKVLMGAWALGTLGLMNEATILRRGELPSFDDA